MFCDCSCIRHIYLTSSGNTTARKGRRNTVRENESDKGNDSVLTDEKEDSIASRMKRRRNQQPDDDDDENNSYVY